MHRLWLCPANLPHLRDLRQQLEDDIFADNVLVQDVIDLLPCCLWRCALPTAECSVSVRDQRAIMLYLLKITQIATIANVNDHLTTETICPQWGQENPIDWPAYAD